MNFTQRFNDNDRAVSPVIGVILMVAVTVILAAVIGTFVLGQSDNLGDAAPYTQIDVTYSDTGDATVLLEQKNGAGDVTVYVTNTDYGTLTTTGDQVTIPNADLEDGDTIRTVYNGESTSQTTSTHQYSSPAVTSTSFECDVSTGHYVVSETGGSELCEYSSVATAVSDANSGATIQVKDGTYEEPLIHLDSPDMTLVGESQDGVILTTTDTNGNIFAQATSDISKLTIDASGSASGIYTGMYDEYTIDSVTVSNAGNAGIFLRNDAATVTNSKLVNNDGIGVDSVGGTTFTDNSIYSNTGGAVGQSDTGTVNMQQNYWGHNDGAATNADCTPDSTRISGSVDTSNALCTAP